MEESEKLALVTGFLIGLSRRIVQLNNSGTTQSAFEEAAADCIRMAQTVAPCEIDDGGKPVPEST